MNETPQQIAAFQLFVSRETLRSIAVTLKVSQRTIANWKSQFNWDSRVTELTTQEIEFKPLTKMEQRAKLAARINAMEKHMSTVSTPNASLERAYKEDIRLDHDIERSMPDNEAAQAAQNLADSISGIVNFKKGDLFITKYPDTEKE